MIWRAMLLVVRARWATMRLALGVTLMGLGLHIIPGGYRERIGGGFRDGLARSMAWQRANGMPERKEFDRIRREVTEVEDAG